MIGDQLGVEPKTLILLDIYAGRFHREWKDSDDASDIRDNDYVGAYLSLFLEIFLLQ